MSSIKPTIPYQQATTFIVKEIIEETFNTKSFVLEPKSDGSKLNYEAGQFFTFMFYSAAGTEQRRNYSISSSPVLKEPLTITVKRIPNGEFSRKLNDNTTIGDELITLGAAGFFTFPEDIENYNQAFFIVAGSGITPAYSLIKTALFLYPGLHLVLLYSNTSVDTTIFYQELLALEAKFPGRISLEFLFSTSSNLAKARLNISLLDQLLKHHSSTAAEKMLFYICGPLDYMRMITIHLNNKNFATHQVKKEIFHIEKPARMPQPPDKGLHKIIIKYGKEEFEFKAQYPATILQAAKENGIKLPYSCESGQCGTCAALCTSGKVWMYNNEVLVEDDLEKGIILTCTGYAIGGDVILEI